MFENRQKAGEVISQKLQKFKGIRNALVLAVPRGGVVIGRAVSDALGIPLGVIYAKKIPTPGQSELAMGARIVKRKRFGKMPKVKDKTVILVDDGIATGATVEAAIKYLRGKKVKKIVLAVPVAPKSLVKKLKNLVDETHVLDAQDNFFAVGDFYRDFSQVVDEEVIQLLQR